MEDIQRIAAVLLQRVANTGVELPVELYVCAEGGRTIRLLVEDAPPAVEELLRHGPVVGAQEYGTELAAAGAIGEEVVIIRDDPKPRRSIDDATYKVPSPASPPCACCQGSG